MMAVAGEARGAVARPTAIPLTGTRFALLFAAGFAIAALPVLLVRVPPLFDYPNHLARMHILAAGAASSLSQYYAVAWALIPDLAMDAVVPLLARVMPLLWAGKVFILLTFLLLAGGAALLHRAVWRSWSASPLLAFLLLYNRMLLWGFLNFLFGLGLAFVTMAAWVALREKRAWLRLPLAAGLALLVFFAHLFAFGCYGLMVAGYELGRLHRSGGLVSRKAAVTLALAGIQFLVPLALLLIPASPAHHGGIEYSRLARKLDLLFSVFDDYSRWFDIASFAAVVLLLLLGLARRAVRLGPALMAPLLLLALAELAMPNKLFGATGVDHRMPTALALLIVAALRNTRPPSRRLRLATLALALLFCVRMAVVTTTWLGYQREEAPLIEALAALPPGSRVAVAYPPTAINIPRHGPPMAHLPCLAVILADAFVPTLFSYPGQQPLALTATGRKLADAGSPGALWSELEKGRGATVAERLAGYDFLIAVGDGAADLAAATGLAPRGRFARAQLFTLTAGRGQAGG